MSRTIHCAKLRRAAEGLAAPPFPGEQGRRIYESVSAQAWGEWLKLQTMLLNEHRLSPLEPKAREFLAREREKFLFGEGADLPEGYTPPKS
jgi:Fe-S cluster biosynthesis and repair protein YggX